MGQTIVLVTLIVAFSMVGYQSLKAALASPADTLRYEKLIMN
ncbi:MAG: hypothetical protein R6W81_12300 [Bacteroidales bacterium]